MPYIFFPGFMISHYTMKLSIHVWISLCSFVTTNFLKALEICIIFCRSMCCRSGIHEQSDLWSSTQKHFKNLPTEHKIWLGGWAVHVKLLLLYGVRNTVQKGVRNMGLFSECSEASSLPVMEGRRETLCWMHCPQIRKKWFWMKRLTETLL